MTSESAPDGVGPATAAATMDGVNPFRRLRAVPDTAQEASSADELMVRAARGDEAAFALLYDELAPLVHGVVLKVLRDPSRAEEVTQEVFVELWRIAARYDAGRGSVRAWTATLAHRRAVDRVRSEQAHRDRNDRVSRLEPTVEDTVATDVEDRFERERVRRSLDELTDLQREAVELAYFGGHTYREVAVLLGVAEGTVKTRIRDGLIRLRDTMGVES
ncbi:MAG: ECF RNA polymerase sigma factor SigK [Acidimicrobiales bacterium]